MKQKPAVAALERVDLDHSAERVEAASAGDRPMMALQPHVWAPLRHERALERSIEPSPAAMRADHQIGLDRLPPRAAGTAAIEADLGPGRRFGDRGDLGLGRRLCACMSRLIEQDPIERASAEPEAFGGEAGFEHTPARCGEAGAIDPRRPFGQHQVERAEARELSDRLRRQELAAQLVARKRILLEQRHAQPSLRQDRGRRGSRGPAADDDDGIAIRQHRPYISFR